MSEKPTYEELEKRVKKLENAEKRFRAIYEQAPLGIAVIDSQTGQFLHINNAYCNIVGYPKADMLELDFMRITHPDDLQEDLDNMARLRAGEISRFQMEKRYYRKDGSLVWVSLTVVPLWEDSADPLHHIAMAENITDRKRSEEAVKTSERKYRNIAESMPGMVLKYKLNPDGSDHLLYISKGVEDLFEISQEDAVRNNKLLWDRVHQDDLEKCAASLKKSAENLSFWKMEHRIQLPDGRVKWVHTRGVPVKQEDGGVVWDSLAVDITDRKNAEQATHEAHSLLQQVIDNSLSLIIAKNKKGEYILANSISEQLLGYKKDKMIGKTDYDLFPKETADRLSEDDNKVFETGKPLQIEEKFKIGDRNYVFMTTKFPLTEQKGDIYAVCGMASDITRRKQMEADLQEALEEKEVLLREIHHRVKNNMQTIISLLRMSANKIDAPDMKRIFDDCRDRISAMALVHETLYQSADLARIDFEAYIKKLCKNLGKAHGARGKGITLATEKCNISMDIDKGIAVGMVISELVSNAFKHAFPDGKGGAVSLRMAGLDAETVELVVADEGIGLPAEIDPNNVSSLGLRLVTGIVTRELSGTLEVERNGGTRFIIRISANVKNKRNA